MNNHFLNKLSEVTEANISNEHFGVSELAREMSMSRTSLHRKIRFAANKTASQFICEIRLKAAIKLLQKGEGTVSEIAYNVGFGSATYFSKCFHDFYGYPPGDVLKGNRQVQEIVVPTTTVRKIPNTSTTLFIIVIAILTVSIAFILIKNSSKNKLEKSVALLTSVYNSNDDKETINFPLESFKLGVKNYLVGIEDISIISSEFSEKYRNSNKSPTEISKKLKANYLVVFRELSSDGNSAMVVELIDARNKVIWSDSQIYNQDFSNNSKIQQTFATSIANELNVTISDEEIENTSYLTTNNPAAISCYNKAMTLMELGNFHRYSDYWQEAKVELEKAIQLDPNFAEAWLKLATIYLSKSLWHEMLLGFFDVQVYNNKLDTARYALNKAIELGVRNTNSFLTAQTLLRRSSGEFDEALKLHKELNKNKEEYEIYGQLGNFYYFNCDYYQSIANWTNYIKLLPENQLSPPHWLDKFAKNLRDTGFPEYSEIIANKRLLQDDDTVAYTKFLIYNKIEANNFAAANEEIQKLYNSDSTNMEFISLQVFINFLLDDYDKAFHYLQQYNNQAQKKGKYIKPSLLTGFIYFERGLDKEAQRHFDSLLKNDIILDSNIYVPYIMEPFILLDLAAVHALKGNTPIALQALKRVAQRETTVLHILNRLKRPYFDCIRNEPEFKQIELKLESIYQKEHKRIEKFLLENGIEPC